MFRQNLKIILIICLISSLGRFVLDSYLPSLPAISHYFMISDKRTQLTLTLYLLGFSLSQLIYGPLSDRYGRRTIILIGLGIFLTGSLICTLALSPMILLLSRLVAGIGAGACGVLNRAIASDCFKGADFSQAWSYTTSALVLTLVFAPILGGYVQDVLGWRGNFFIATIFVIAVFIIILQFLPETKNSLTQPNLKIRAVIVSYYRILFSKTFFMCTLCYTLAFSGLILYFQISPLLFINVYGLTATQYGWSSLVIAGSYLVGGILVTKLAHHLSIQALLFIGTILLISGGVMMLLAYYCNQAYLLAVLLPAAVYVLGARIVIPNAIAGSMEEFRHLNGSSSALIGCIQMLGSSMISLLITNFSYKTPYPLGLFLTVLGLLSLTVVFFIKQHRVPC
ncbi:MAG: multidrug effflux MFS transporter [Gammaproteobacteria bacterium]|nr:multidrug effflux MFS transporter [Gammaproteobacteria bacterium]